MIRVRTGLLLLLLVGRSAMAGAAPEAPVRGLALDRRPDLLVSVDLPPGSRDDLPADPLEVGGGWVLVSTVHGVRTWQVALPVRPRTLFFHRPPEGMEVLRRVEGQPWAQADVVEHEDGINDADDAGTWEFTTHLLRVRRPAKDGPPDPGEYAVRYPKAVTREQELQRSTFHGTDAAFVMRGFQVDDSSRHGLLLPAPAVATFELQVPERGVLELAAGILPPEAVPTGRQSDGASLLIRVDGSEIGRMPLFVGEHRPARHDLSTWQGQTIRLELVVEPGESTDLDYAFIASPVVFTPEPDPPRVVVLFVDTLRQDGLSMYGYHRQTTPALDAWAEGGAVFEQARSVAPWTLPSARALFLGTQPERWEETLTLQERASQAGWATAFMSGNVYLSSNFDMDRGWDMHRCINWPIAEVQVRRARQWLEEHPDRPALLVLHLMDMHLPYTEPRAWRHTYAGEHVAALGFEQFQRRDVVGAVAAMGAAGKQYVRDRYDNNLRYVDHELGRFVADLGPQDTVILLADHGEEFWDHGDFEHGHSVYDELLRVPLVARGPGIQPGRVDLPVSLIDVAPTLARAMGLDPQDMTGLPLQGAADGSAAKAFRDRPIGFGRPLYGERRWGVVDGELKYTSHDGAEKVFDLSKDPAEKSDLVLKAAHATDALAQAMARGLEAPVATALRLSPSRSTSPDDLVVVAQVPGGVARAWAADDPLDLAEVVIDTTVDSEARITWKGRTSGEREVYLLPVRPLPEVLPELVLTVQHKASPVTLAPVRAADWPQPWHGRPTLLLRGRSGGRTVTVDYARVPVPSVGTTELTGVDAELQEDLKALGYVAE